jgi:hypothetical protein
MIESITFDLSGWHEHEREQAIEKERIVWYNAYDILSLDVLPASSKTFKPLEQDWIDDARQMAKPGGIVSVDSYTVGSRPAIQIIYKKIHGTGYLYTGILVMEYRGYWCQVTAVCGEHGTTGIREAGLTKRLLAQGKIKIREHPFYLRPFKRTSGYLEGWFQDPHNPRYKGTILRSITDNEEYDAEFSYHPLSRLRSTLKTVRDSLRFAN